MAQAKSCAVIVADANDFVREVHDRMPVLLQPRDFDAWLSGSAGLGYETRRSGNSQRAKPTSWRAHGSSASAATLC